MFSETSRVHPAADECFAQAGRAELTIAMATFRIHGFGRLSVAAGRGEQPCGRQTIA